ncbi:T9SS type A sorting domain-containing protein [Cytophagaceae bacterium 50C-KIRBA]|uniref:T9SS type A sorting domain-containing protein n=1 Tax=Aquirufa beregesia TaxID=2516556 RepID=A0ABX0EXV1_9BACT|nr:T9SS type A sorting domain-containing protein [Aquirufa beregesia]NGZ44881.1 T9SS type A sorting domain-containing protein [Aquirufa beregesia]
MKTFILSALLGTMGTLALAQDAPKSESTIKIVVDENGKQKVIERTFANPDLAEAGIKQLNDSLNKEMGKSDGKTKIITMDIRKRGGNRMQMDAMGSMPHLDKKAMARVEKRMRKLRTQMDDKQVRIFRHGPDDMEIHMEDMPGGKNFKFDFDENSPEFRGLRRLQEDGFSMAGQNSAWGQASSTIKGLFANPNHPFNGKLNIRFHAPEKGTVAITVRDVNGKEVASETVKDFQGRYLGQVDLKKAASGVYFVQVTQGNDGAVIRVKID